jgi:hypothetical protein
MNLYQQVENDPNLDYSLFALTTLSRLSRCIPGLVFAWPLGTRLGCCDTFAPLQLPATLTGINRLIFNVVNPITTVLVSV